MLSFRACCNDPIALIEMASDARKRHERALPMAQPLSPSIKRLKVERKNHVNRLTALELVQKSEEGRQRLNREVVKRAFEQHAAAHGEDLIDKTAVCRFRKDILEGRAKEWLPAGAELPQHIAVSQDSSSTVSGLTDEKEGSPNSIDSAAASDKGGRPKGATRAAKDDLARRKSEACTAAARRHADLQTKAIADGNKQVACGVVPSFVRNIEVEHGLPVNALNLSTILA